MSPIRFAGLAVVSLIIALGLIYIAPAWFGGCTAIRATEAGIYHEPGSAYYDQVKEPTGCFVSVADAEAAGYRRPGAWIKPGPDR